MCILLFDVFNWCSLITLRKKIKKYSNIKRQTFTIKKNWEKLKIFYFLEKKIWRNALALKSKKVQGISGETFILALSSSAVFRLQNHVSDFL